MALQSQTIFDGITYKFSPVLTSDDGNIIYSTQYYYTGQAAYKVFQGPVSFDYKDSWYSSTTDTDPYIGYDYKEKVYKQGVMMTPDDFNSDSNPERPGYGHRIRQFEIYALQDNIWNLIYTSPSNLYWVTRATKFFKFNKVYCGTAFKLRIIDFESTDNYNPTYYTGVVHRMWFIDSDHYYEDFHDLKIY